MQKYNTLSISLTDLPDIVNQLHQPIKNLSGKGNTDLLNTGVKVGIVGARKFTPYGREVTADIASTLARAGVTIVSGLALGVDSIAHKACVDAGGKTIAVLPSGIDKIYPVNHYQLGQQILEKDGLLISEYASDHLPMKHDFIERNRIIAALSDVLVVTEAAVASGSLHTAGFALELGITVMAVPGNITSPYSAGCNQLIQNGAYPILSPQNILDHLGITTKNKLAYLPENEVEALILQNIGANPTNTQQLIESTDLSTSELQTHLTLLEIKGVLEVQSGLWRIK